MPNGQLDLGAPLGRWDRQQSFTSSDECKNGRERLLNLQAGPGTTARELAEMRRVVLTSQCVTAENPRLKEKWKKSAAYPQSQTCGSRCLVTGAKGIRTAGPLCGF